MPSVTHTNEALETSQQSTRSEDAHSEMSKEDEDKMIDNILAKHGIRLGEKTSSDVPAVKDSADRILDNIDAQLGDVKIKSLAKKPASVNGDITEYAVDQNYQGHTEATLPLRSSSYGYKARSLNDLSRTSVNDEDTYFSQGLGRRPLTARKAREASSIEQKPKDNSDEMPLLSAESSLRDAEERMSIGGQDYAQIYANKIEKEENLQYKYKEPEIEIFGPKLPDKNEILECGYLKHVRESSDRDIGGGYSSYLACNRALQESFIGLLWQPQSKFSDLFPA